MVAGVAQLQLVMCDGEAHTLWWASTGSSGGSGGSGGREVDATRNSEQKRRAPAKPALNQQKAGAVQRRSPADRGCG